MTQLVNPALVSSMLARTAAIRQQIAIHPFNQTLYKGTLPKEVFESYLKCDAFYLKKFAQVLETIACRVTNKDHQSFFSFLSKEMVNAELDIHRHYLKQLQFFKPLLDTTHKPRPVIISYIQHLEHCAKKEDIPVAISATLACPLIYRDLGLQMNMSDCPPGNPYRSWISTYSDKSFVQATEDLVQVVEHYNKKIFCPILQEKISAAFYESAHYELKFFDSACIESNESLVNDHASIIP